MTETDVKVLAAVVGGIATIVSALVAGLFSIYLKRRAERDLEAFKAEQVGRLEAIKAEQAGRLEQLKSDLTYENKLRSARLDYEYEAKKRLYKEVGPIIFAAHMAATQMRARLITLADRIRDGSIVPDATRNWFASDPYYQQSTVYRIFVPMTYYLALSKRISQFDLTLEPLIGRKFMALAIFNDIPAADFDLAKISAPPLPYEPYADGAEEKIIRDPARFKFQGIVRGDVERLVSLMLLHDNDNLVPIEWFKFEEQLKNKRSDLSKAYAPVREILHNFHPSTHPVVWRALIAQVLASEFFIEARDYSIEEFDSLIDVLGWQRFDFRSPGHQADTVARTHFEAARLFVRKKLSDRFRSLHVANESREID